MAKPSHLQQLWLIAVALSITSMIFYSQSTTVIKLITKYRTSVSQFSKTVATDYRSRVFERLHLNKNSSSNSLTIGNISESFILPSCNSAIIRPWAEQILLRKFTISCGIDSLRAVAHELSSGEVRDDDHYKNISQTTRNLHKVLQSEFLTKVRGSDKSRTMPTRPDGNHAYSNATKSLGFLKAYKVGGTTISSLLITYAYSHNLNIDGSGTWSGGQNKRNRYRGCVDVAGTNHPPPSFYQGVTNRFIESYFCNELVTFMFVRDPVQRVWSAYNHHKRSCPGDSLDKFLSRPHQTLISPHHLLSVSFEKAVQLASTINIFSQDSENMDKSLVMLTMEAGLSICDIMYKPCGEDNLWSVSKCNDGKRVLDTKSKNLISTYLRHKTKENAFYEIAMKRFNKSIEANSELQHRLTKYLEMRRDAVRACSTDVSYKAWENIFFVDPNITLFNARERRMVLIGENYYSIVPSWVCMQSYCQRKLNFSRN